MTKIWRLSYGKVKNEMVIWAKVTCFSYTFEHCHLTDVTTPK